MAKMALVIPNVFKSSKYYGDFKFSPDPKATTLEACDYFVKNYHKVTHYIDPEGLGSIRNFLMSRKEAEKNDDFLQLIPYVIVTRKVADEQGNTSLEVLSYMRGQKGGENRLHGRVSIGIGGHVEEESTNEKHIWTVIKEAAEREVKEETGLTIKNPKFSGYGSVI